MRAMLLATATLGVLASTEVAPAALDEVNPGEGAPASNRGLRGPQIASGGPPCQTTCTGPERRRMDRELRQLRVYEQRLQTWRRWALTIVPYRGWLSRLRACESGGNWRIVNSLGYAGAYQFGGWAWAAAGGHGRPQDAHPLEQSYRAVVLRRAYGLGQWSCQVGS